MATQVMGSVAAGAVIGGLYYLSTMYFDRIQQFEDEEFIDRINTIIYEKMRNLPSYLEKDFGEQPRAKERDAAHSLWIRVFIRHSNLPNEMQALIKTLTEDQRKVGIAYLSAIDQGEERGIARTKYSKQYVRVEKFVREFIAKADQDEKDFYAAKGRSTPESFVEGSRTRPKSVDQIVDLGPKFWRHPVTALMLAEFRRDLCPPAQKEVDKHFHNANMESRPTVVTKMYQGKQLAVKVDFGTITEYCTPIQVEFFPDRLVTEQPSYYSHIQGEGALTTQGVVKKYEFNTGNVAYLIKYIDYKEPEMPEKYLVSNVIPLGVPGDRYHANLDLSTAESKILEYNEAPRTT